MALESNTFTKAITNDSLTIQSGFGVRKLSIYNASAVTGTVTGNATLGDQTSSALDIEEGESFTIIASNDNPIAGVTITAPASCTLKVLAEI